MVSIKNNFTYQKLYFSSDTIKRLHKSFIAFDVETTGLSASNNKIIELGAVLFENDEPVKVFNSLVNIEEPIPSFITSITGITSKMIEDAPFENVVYKEFVSFMDKALNKEIIVCAHNASFDMSFLYYTLNRLGFSGTILYVDTLELSRRKLCLQNHKQSTICKYLNIVNEEEHRASTDALACGKILVKLINM